MKAFTAALLGLSLAGSAAAQERRLSDIASDIELRPPSENAMLIDLGSEGRATAPSSGVVELADAYRESLEAVSGLLAGAGEDDRFYAEDWRDRMQSACLELDTVGYSVAASRAPARYAEAYGELIDASRGCARATSGIREAIRLDKPMYGPAMRNLSGCRADVSRSVEEIHRIRRTEIQEAQPELEDPLAAAVGIAELCRERTGGGGPVFDECVAAQDGARRAISNRFSFSVLLDEATFNEVRNSCRAEWPSDFIGRDRCERRRIAEAH